MNEFIKSLQSFGLPRLAGIIGVSAGVAIALALIMMRLGQSPMGVLYADLDYLDAQQITTELDQRNVSYQLRERSGSVNILAPSTEIEGLRVSLAGSGIAVTNGVGYELFDDNDVLGATTFQQNINRLRALEGELARTISSIAGVRSARVHLVMAERELFARDRNAASASIVVDAPSGIEQRSVRAIVNLVASAVPALEPSSVTVLDGSGRLLAAGGSGETDTALASSIEEQKIAAQSRIEREIENMVGRIVGAENVRVEVSAEMDFSRVTESSEIVDPDSQTVLSSTIVEELSNRADPAAGAGVSVANALPGANAQTAAGPNATSSSQRTEETTNFEISKTVRSAVREEGLVIERISVAVALNSAAATRTPNELAQIDALVKSAIGFSQARGDQVSVIDIAFAEPTALAPAGATATTPIASTPDMMRIAEIGALGAIGIALVVFGLRPILAAKPSQPSVTVELPPAAQSTNAAITDQSESRIDLAQVEGKVKASSVNQVSEIVKTHADESASILRNWMREAS